MSETVKCPVCGGMCHKVRYRDFGLEADVSHDTCPSCYASSYQPLWQRTVECDDMKAQLQRIREKWQAYKESPTDEAAWHAVEAELDAIGEEQ